MDLFSFINIAVRNVFRNRIRSFITILAIAFGSSSLIIAGGFFEDTFMRMREGVIHSHLGHIQINLAGYELKGSTAPFDYLIEEPQEIIDLIESVNHVELVTPRISFYGLISTGENTVSVLCQGIVPEAEAQLNIIKNMKPPSKGFEIQAGKDLNKDDLYDMIIGRGLSNNIGGKIGDSLVIMAQTTGGSINAYDINLKGEFFTASKEFDDRAVRMPLETAKSLVRTKGVQTLVVLLEKTEQTELVKNELKTLFKTKNLNLELKSWDELAEFYNKTVELYSRQFFVLKLIIMAIVILSIFNAINMSIRERTREIGTIMAIGYLRSDIMKQFLLEGIIIGFVGGLFGIFLGSASAYIISIFGIPMPPPPGSTIGWTAMIKIVPDLLITSFLISIGSSLISSFYPAYTASRLQITDALRYY